MTLFADPSFFVLLAVAVAGAAAIGLSGHTLRHYGLAVSVGFLACVFFKTPAQLAALLAFVAVARAAVLFLARDPKDKRRINADAKLKPVFGLDSVTMFEMNKHLARHLS